jgi:molybdate/tungstate transport system permease protein
MKRTLKPTYIVFAALGGVLLLDLILPIATLFVHADWQAWFAELWQVGAREAIWVSVASSSIAVFIMMILGIPLGYFLARAPLRFKSLWVGLVFLPMVVPDLAGGILLLQTFGPYSWIGRVLDTRNIELTNNLAGVVLAQLFVAAPFVVVSSIAGFASVDRELEQAAATLGDSRWQIFWNISLPLSKPSIAAGITLAWIRALGEFGATIIVAYNPHSLPVYMWVKFEADGLPSALPIAFCLVLLAVTAVAISMLFSRLSGQTDLIAPIGELGGTHE